MAPPNITLHLHLIGIRESLHTVNSFSLLGKVHWVSLLSRNTV